MSSIIDDLKTQYKFGGIAQKLIFCNIAIFLVSLLFFYQFNTGLFNFPDWIALSSETTVFIFKPWTLLTYSFFHDGFGHLFFNLMVLHFSSQLFLTFFNQKQWLGVYILSAIFAGIVFVLSYYFLNLSASIVGASAAIMAILVATTTYSPLMDVRLLLIGNVKLWHITLAILVIDLMQIRMDNTGGHIAHLAGAFFGYIYIKLLENGTDLSKIVSNTINFFVNLFSYPTSTPFKKVHKNYKKPVGKVVSKIITKDRKQQQVDEILDKISRSGYDSLSKDEKDFLFQSGK
jgi:membrane associated rhomboid family serine protease